MTRAPRLLSRAKVTTERLPSPAQSQNRALGRSPARIEPAAAVKRQDGEHHAAVRRVHAAHRERGEKREAEDDAGGAHHDGRQLGARRQPTAGRDRDQGQKGGREGAAEADDLGRQLLHRPAGGGQGEAEHGHAQKPPEQTEPLLARRDAGHAATRALKIANRGERANLVGQGKTVGAHAWMRRNCSAWWRALPS